MKNILFILSILFIFGFTNQLSAQKYNCRNEIGILAGLNSYSGDIAQKSTQLEETRFGFGAFYRHEFGNSLAVRAQIYKGRLTGDDRHNSELSYRKFRFHNNFFEVSALGEWHFWGNANVDEFGWARIKPYVFGGIGYVRANQTTEAYGSSEEIFYNTNVPFPEPGLQQNIISAPFGLGIRVAVTDQLILGGQGSFHPTFSDYLDGVRLNAASRGNDWFFSLGLTLSYKLQSSNPCRMF